VNLIRPRSNRIPVYRDDVAKKHGPVLSGIRTEHWDGRVDATVFAPHIRVQSQSMVIAPGEAGVIEAANREQGR